MKRFLSVTLLTLFCISCVFFAVEVKRDTSEKLAVCLVESFGWNVAETAKIKSKTMTVRDFYVMYYQWTGEFSFFPAGTIAQRDVERANLAGMRPVLYDKTYYTASDTEENVTVYFISLDYDTPEDIILEAMVGFYQDELCITAIHIQGTDKIWPLDVEKDKVAPWIK